MHETFRHEISPGHDSGRVKLVEILEEMKKNYEGAQYTFTPSDACFIIFHKDQEKLKEIIDTIRSSTDKLNITIESIPPKIKRN